jgi:hypothetical protein
VKLELDIFDVVGLGSGARHSFWFVEDCKAEIFILYLIYKIEKRKV